MIVSAGSRVYDLSVLRLAQLDVGTGQVFKTFANVDSSASDIFYVVEASSGHGVRITQSGHVTLIKEGREHPVSIGHSLCLVTSPIVAVTGLATSDIHPALLAQNPNNSAVVRSWDKRFNNPIVHKPTFAQALLELFAGNSPFIICPVSELSVIELLIVDALKQQVVVESSNGMLTIRNEKVTTETEQQTVPTELVLQGALVSEQKLCLVS